MAKFTDNKNRTFDIALDGPTIRELRSAEGCMIDLIDEEGQAMQRLAGDPVLLVDVLWHLCSKQCLAAEIDATNFAEGLVGDAIENAANALVQAVVDFFPKRKRALLTAIVSEQRKIEDEATESAMTKLTNPQLRERVKGIIEKALDERVEEALTRLASATSSPDTVPFHLGA